MTEEKHEHQDPDNISDINNDITGPDEQAAEPSDKKDHTNAVWKTSRNSKLFKLFKRSDKKILGGVFLLILIFIVLFYSSHINSNKFFIHEKNGALLIYTGEFAPDGKKLLVSMPGISGSIPVTDYYTKEQIYPFIYQYYLERAHILKSTEGMPDFEGISYYLKKARLFISTEAEDAVISKELKALESFQIISYEFEE